ncbi:peptidoglycan/LPS O-acetylase OafA/YrhL [Cupriavidus alkaliphilus]|uniref:acyltransferase family protein n=1 Tax=Cupriavidus alkaliphilus TaxID=942866 RepID=UPI000DE71767|nr:acyltransferase [Cupriavidus alkaliphilus]PVY78729.1 peptidoglycan/LPS O-acetylase OafA/YrhL [Cupriavidus alkaliphilus]
MTISPWQIRIRDSELRFSNIDALRAIAALLVLWMHASEVFIYLVREKDAGGEWVYRLSDIFDFGRIGVVSFFAISGFVVPMSLKGPASATELKLFAIGRFFRLYPAFWVSIVPGAVTFYWIWGKSFTIWDLLLNFTMMPEWLGALPAEGLYWTLQIEMVFYAICAILFWMDWLRNADRLFQVCFTFFIGYALLRDKAYAINLAHLSIMFFGALCRQLVSMNDGIGRRRLLRAIGLYASLWLIFIPAYGVVAIMLGKYDYSVSRFFLAYGIGILLFLLVLALPNLNAACLVWLGRISYSIYLLHPIVLFSLYWIIGRGYVPWMQALNLGVYVALCALITIVLAAVNFYLVEEPARRLGQRIKRRIRLQSQGDASLLRPN